MIDRKAVIANSETCGALWNRRRAANLECIPFEDLTPTSIDSDEAVKTRVTMSSRSWLLLRCSLLLLAVACAGCSEQDAGSPAAKIQPPFECGSDGAAAKGPLVFTPKPVLDKLFTIKQDRSGTESWELVRECPASEDDHRPKSTNGTVVLDDE